MTAKLGDFEVKTVLDQSVIEEVSTDFCTIARQGNLFGVVPEEWSVTKSGKVTVLFDVPQHAKAKLILNAQFSDVPAHGSATPAKSGEGAGLSTTAYAGEEDDTSEPITDSDAEATMPDNENLTGGAYGKIVVRGVNNGIDFGELAQKTLGRGVALEPDGSVASLDVDTGLAFKCKVVLTIYGEYRADGVGLVWSDPRREIDISKEITGSKQCSQSTPEPKQTPQETPTSPLWRCTLAD